ncbi:hypothetical protein [Arthrobacter mobilis]|uniref:hypothetical protein n=1 Tax=Arthrobacter mobilis TaxID=2724944 RepID=UPI00197B9A42|nr:hypothetical protein [Arthrobacter mobilis]
MGDERGNVMQAVWNVLAGIEGECGGEISCTPWVDKDGKASYDERDLLEMVQGLRSESRPSC